MDNYRQSSRGQSLTVKHYIVVSDQGGARLRIIASKLTRRAAERIAERNPGSYVEKLISDK